MINLFVNRKTPEGKRVIRGIQLATTGVFFLFGIIYFITSINAAFSGRTISTSLVEEEFDELAISLPVPDDWILHDTSSTAYMGEELEDYSIIQGQQDTSFYPRINIYRFTQESFSEGALDAQTILDLDIERINAQNDVLFVHKNTDEGGIEDIYYEYLTNVIVILKKDKIIQCKDWISEDDNTFLLVSICATELQWGRLDEVYEKIIYSIEY